MRLGVFFLFFAIILATASPPTVAQLSPPPPPDVEKPVKKEKPPKGDEPKPPKGDEPKPPEGDEPKPPEGDEPTPPEGDEPTPPEGDEPKPPEGEEGGPEGEKGDPDGEEVGPGGDDRAGLDRSTNGSSSGDEDGLSSLVSHAGCSEECDPPGTLTNRGEGEAIRNAADAESIGELEGESLVPSAAADASPPVLALFALMVLCLLVGLAGGLRALHGRIRGD